MLFLFLLPVIATGLKLTPPENIWVREGETNVTMLCVASETIRSCSWGTPYGKVYPLESGLMAEGGRMLHKSRQRTRASGLATWGWSSTARSPRPVASPASPWPWPPPPLALSSLKTKDQKKGVDDTLATEWEKVSLVDEKEKKAEEEMKKEKAGLASKVTALLTKLRPEKKEEEVKVEEVKEEEEKKDEEKKVEEEKEEDKPSTEEKPVRRGSETPV